MADRQCDVAIIGGGPAGSTVGSLLKRYAPAGEVVILEREQFPREHIGESQLPLISRILNEMGAWEKVEAANFPIKIGGTYRWGATDELWDFEFLPDGKMDPAPRPGKYVGQRQSTAFQVDRGIYDKILLDHASEMGCQVLQAVAAKSVARTGDKVDGLELSDGTTLEARYYVDASGNSAILRRAMDVAVDHPTNLRNIAIWDYWRNAEWAVSIGVGGTRIQVLALDVGWLWFIPLGSDRTSIGLVIPAAHYKADGRRPAEIYLEAVRADKIVSTLIRNATAEGPVRTTRDWSFVAERLTGDNWFLAGEAAGFADPILSAGMSLAHSGARDVAYAILSLDRSQYEPTWIKQQYCENHRGHIRQHIAFADFWYTSQGAFSDLRTHAQGIARDAGLDMTPLEAWQWLGQGGFIDASGSTDIGFFGALATKELFASFTGEQAEFAIEGKTHFRIDLDGAQKDWVAELSDGRMTRHRAYRRGPKVLPLVKSMGWISRYLLDERSFADIRSAVKAEAAANSMSQSQYHFFWSQTIKCLETLVGYGWVVARAEDGYERCPRFQADLERMVHANRDVALILEGERAG